jgi:hypothetical protein
LLASVVAIRVRSHHNLRRPPNLSRSVMGRQRCLFGIDEGRTDALISPRAHGRVPA